MGTTERPVFAEFLLGDLFECGKGDVDLQQRDINGKGELFINSGLENKGIKGRTDRPAKVFPAGTLTIDFWGNAFYRDEPYKLATHNHVFSLSGDVPRNEAAGLYIEASLAHLPQLFSYTNMATWPKLRELSNSLPVTPSTDLNYEYTPDDIDWAYMERYIAELEQERIAELDAYLKAAGLDDCALTAEDEAALVEQPVFAEFKVGELFEVYSPKKRFDANKIKFGGKHPYVARGSANNGIRGYIDEDEQYLSPAKSLSFGQDTATVFYQEEAYFTGDKIKVMVLRDHELNPAHANYFLAAISKAFSGFAWGQSSFNQKVLENVALSLPVTPSTDLNYEYTPDDIDWAYMERCIAELEQERIAELDAYLKAAGLDDCALTAEDEAALAEQPVFAEFLLKDIAELGYGNKFDKNKMTHNNPCYNFVGRAEKNNGITDFVDDNGTEPYPAGSITLAFGGSIGSTFIQPKPYYTSQNVGVITLPDGVSENAKLYFTKALEKVCKNRYVAFADEINKHFKTDLAISLPVVPSTDPDHSYTPDDIDWAYMERYIRAIEKQVVVGVVEYKDKVIETTKQFIA